MKLMKGAVPLFFVLIWKLEVNYEKSCIIWSIMCLALVPGLLRAFASGTQWGWLQVSNGAVLCRGAVVLFLSHSMAERRSV